MMEIRFSHDAIARILKEASFREELRDAGRFNRDVLDALHELTRIPRAELDEIAGEVSSPGDSFSVRRQLLLAAGFIAAAGMPLGLLWSLL